MSEYDFDNCNPDEIVPVIHLHGTADNVVSYTSGAGGVWGDEGVLEIIDLWTDMMGTTEEYETDLPNLEPIDLSSVEFFRFYGAPGGQEFHHYRVSGGGHDWFGVWGNQDIQSTELLWDFFQSHCAGEFTNVNEALATEPVLAYWNGDHVGLLANSSVTAWDAQGRKVWCIENAAKGSRINRSELQGVMMLQVMGNQGNSSVLRIR